MIAKQRTYFPITHNAVFGWGLYQNPNICKELLETVLKIKIDHLDFLTSEQELMANIISRSVRLDVYAESKGRIFDIEMQLTNQGDLLKRMRLYQASMDSAYLDKGDFFSDLPESYLIFFCGFDPFKQKEALYRFETICTTCSNVKDSTGANWYIFNFNDYDKYPSTTGETKELLKYFSTNEVGSTKLVKDLDKMVLSLNGDTKWVNQLVTLEQKQRWDIEFARRQAKAEGIAEGEARGRAEGKVEGIAEGKAEGVNDVAKLYAALEQSGRLDEFARALTDESCRKKLFDEFNI